MSTAPLIAPPPSSQPVCPEHPERVGVGTCHRCGRFVCQECSAGPICPSCVKQSLVSMPGSGTRATAAALFLWMNAAIDVLLIPISAWAIALPGENVARDLLEGLLGLGTLVAFIGAVIAFLMWLHSAVRQSNALGMEVGVTPGWAVGWWFIPFANLVKPYHTIRGLTSAVGGESLVGSLSIGLWWATWIIGNVLGNIEGRMAISEGLTEVPSEGARVVGIASAFASAVAAYLCVRIVRGIQGKLDERRRSAGA